MRNDACRRRVEGVSKPLSRGEQPSSCPSLDAWEVIGVASGRPPTVSRSQGSSTVFLTFEGTRDAKVRDRDTRIRIALADVQAARLWRLLGERLSDAERRATD